MIRRVSYFVTVKIICIVFVKKKCPICGTSWDNLRRVRVEARPDPIVRMNFRIYDVRQAVLSGDEGHTGGGDDGPGGGIRLFRRRARTQLKPNWKGMQFGYFRTYSCCLN